MLFILMMQATECVTVILGWNTKVRDIMHGKDQ